VMAARGSAHRLMARRNRARTIQSESHSDWTVPALHAETG